MAMSITSPAFAHDGEIPGLYTCDGRDVSPALDWQGAASGTKCFALIVDDPDAPDPQAPKMTWVHWILYNIPSWVKGIPLGARELPPGTRHGLNDWKRTGYGGPCPPVGRHRYFFKLYALSTILPDLNTPVKSKLEAAMTPHILARAELVGTYQR